MIRSGAGALLAQARGDEGGIAEILEVELRPTERLYRLDGREVPPREYRGRLEVVVYSTDRLRVVHGTMRERRQYLDRQAAALWPSYHAELRAFERLLTQRNAALATGARDTDVWTERFVESAVAAAPPPRALRRAAHGRARQRLPPRRRELRGPLLRAAGERRRVRPRSSPASSTRSRGASARRAARSPGRSATPWRC